MNKWVSAWKYRCPRCRKAPLFVEPFDFGNPLAMHHSCENCDQRFEPEPGYYYGAMFISYGLSCFLLLPLALFVSFYLKWPIGGTMALVIFLGVVCFMRILRFSRSLWIHLLIKYRPSKGKK